MVTGDARPVAGSVAAELGIGEVFAEVFAQVLPGDKDRIVAALQERGRSYGGGMSGALAGTPDRENNSQLTYRDSRFKRDQPT
ncbi:hypothetical protein [Streptosporangium sp. NPDC002524]|uniref:hypothetical protein n=1 Tax=Streptosporangium sp. NPDC002524 TaxID=3154537 RepID=UPI003328144F